MSDTSTEDTIPGDTRTHRLFVIAGLGVALVIVAAARMLIGESIPRDFAGEIIWEDFGEYLRLRANRVAVAAVVGAALSAAGAVLQSLLRNPLASPYVLGVSTGAALGVVLAWSGWIVAVGVVGANIAALVGALGTMVVVYALAQKRGMVDPIGLLLVGVILNSINAAAIMFIQSLEPTLRGDLLSWMMGHLSDDTTAAMLIGIAVITGVGTAIAAWLGPAMDLATFSDTEARAMGVSLDRLRLILFAVAGVLTAAAVMLAGPIGFVGLICPHAVRLMIGPAHRWVVIGSALAGGIVIIGADAATKLLDTGLGIGQLPIGVLTALIGGPVFIAMLRPQLGRGGTL